jgi:transcriptional regulator with XRE-family HTH domain
LAKSGVVFGRNLRRVCKSRQLTAAALAKRIGRSQQTVERMLAGESNPGLTIINDIARKLRVPIADLVRGL